MFSAAKKIAPSMKDQYKSVEKELTYRIQLLLDVWGCRGLCNIFANH
jgi:hypothetical protein